jgi:hypothetical protein
MVYSNPYEAEKVAKRKIYYIEGQPDTIKSDCKEGRFVPIGNPDKEICPTEIEMQVLKYANIQNAVMFEFDEATVAAHNWTQVFYTDKSGVIFSTLLKNESRDNFLKALRSCEVETEGALNYSDFTFIAKMEKRLSDKKVKYFAVTFDKKPIDSDDHKRNAEFCKEKHEEICDLRTIKEYIDKNMSLVPHDQINKAIADVMFGFGLISEARHKKLISSIQKTQLLKNGDN